MQYIQFQLIIPINGILIMIMNKSNFRVENCYVNQGKGKINK